MNEIPTTRRRKLRLATITMAVTTALVTGGLLAAAPASAASSQCGSGTCTVLLTKSETLALSQGRVPNLNLGPYTLPYRALAYGHVVIAKGWVARGNCVGFTVNVRPWATQGMFGYQC